MLTKGAVFVEGGSEWATPKCNTLACGLFWAKDNWDPAGSTETSASPLTM